MKKKEKENNTIQDYPCDNCSWKDGCDGWEAQYCCILCTYNYGEGNTPCDWCDPWDI